MFSSIRQRFKDMKTISALHGVAPRALRSMGIDADDLAAAAQAEIEGIR